MLISLFLITGCAQPEKAEMGQNKDQENEPPQSSAPPDETEIRTIETIHIKDGEFQGANGWLSNDQLVYTVKDGAISKVIAYNLFSGDQELLYESSHPI